MDSVRGGSRNGCWASNKQCLLHLGLSVRAVAIGHQRDVSKKRFIICRDVKTIIKLTLSQATFFLILLQKVETMSVIKYPSPRKPLVGLSSKQLLQLLLSFSNIRKLQISMFLLPVL